MDSSAQTNGTVSTQSTAIPPPHTENCENQHVPEDAPPAYGSPSPLFGSPAPDTAASHHTQPSINSSSHASNSYTATRSPDSPSDQQPSVISTATSSIKDTLSIANQTLQEQLRSAKATIVELTSQAEQQTLRLRKSDTINQDARERITTGTTGMGVQPLPTDGVPVQIVAGLCLLSFLLAYFFF